MQRLPAPLVLVAVALLLASAASAQAQPRPHELTVDVRDRSAEVGMAWRYRPTALWGLSLGVGTDRGSSTIVPTSTQEEEQVAFEQTARGSFFYRYQPGSILDLEVGARGGVGSLLASDDDTSVMMGFYGGLFVGSRYLKVGTRAVIVSIWHDSPRGVLNVEGITVRAQLPF